MRLFAAVELSPAVTAAALDLVALIRTKVERLAPHSRITWVTPDRMHVTVRFIGHVADGEAEAIIAALRPPIGVDPFDLTFAGVGAFPVRGAPRVLWTGLAGGVDGLNTVEAIISTRLAAVGLAREDRPFNPHLTLARIRDAGGLQTRALLDGLEDVALGSVSVDAITLFESRLSPKGPNYLALQRTPLT